MRRTNNRLKGAKLLPKILGLTLFALFLFTTAYPQPLKLVKRENPHHQIYLYEVRSSQVKHLQFPDIFTPVVLELEGKKHFKGLYLDTFEVQKG